MTRALQGARSQEAGIGDILQRFTEDDADRSKRVFVGGLHALVALVALLDATTKDLRQRTLLEA